MRCRKEGYALPALTYVSLLLVSLLVRVAGCIPASSSILPSLSSTQGGQYLNAGKISQLFPIPNSDLALRFWACGDEVEPWTMRSNLIVAIAFLREQIDLHGDEAHPPNGELKYELGDDADLLITKIPGDPYGLNWSELNAVFAGLSEYIVTGMRYRTVTFDILDIVDDAQIGWGRIVVWGRESVSNRSAKRDLHLSPPALPSSNPIPGQRNSSVPTLSKSSTDWPIDDSDLSLSFTSIRVGRDGREPLDPELVKNLFVVVIEIIQHNIADPDKGEGAPLGDGTFRYGKQVVLEVINWPHMLTWGQFATTVLGLIDFIVDHDHNRSWYFSIFEQNPKTEIAIGRIRHGIVQENNVTVARKESVTGDGLGW